MSPILYSVAALKRLRTTAVNHLHYRRKFSYFFAENFVEQNYDCVIKVALLASVYFSSTKRSIRCSVFQIFYWIVCYLSRIYWIFTRQNCARLQFNSMRHRNDQKHEVNNIFGHFEFLLFSFQHISANECCLKPHWTDKPFQSL